MISRLHLVNYKGFRDFTLNIKGNAVLVGPNNAGKTTIIAALRLCTHLIKQAQLRKPDLAIRDEVQNRDGVGYRLSVPANQFVEENIHYEFREEEARIELTMKSGSALYAIWPADDDPFFYLEHVKGMQPMTVRVVKDNFPSVGVVPTLSPIEHREFILSDNHVRDNLSSKLVSRHFRNQLYAQRDRNPEAYESLKRFIVENTPEIIYFELTASLTGTGDRELDLYYCESSTRTEKELYWAGDGLQIWLQVLFHIWRQQNAEILVLDEPDVFLHPDLQRRLVRVLEDLDSQVILATHAPEILAEVGRDSVVLVDRTRRLSKRIADDQALGYLNDALGSGFNLRLAKALRSRVVLFVEGQDMKILSNIAKTLGANRFAREQGLAVVPMEGYSKRGMSGSFGWLNSQFLDGAVEVFVVLDRDYRPDSVVKSDVDELRQAGVHAFVWTRKELESYLLVPEAIARISRVDVGRIREYLRGAVDTLRSKVVAHCLAERNLEMRSSGQDPATINERFMADFEQRWREPSWRLSVVPPKEVLSIVNQQIQTVGGRPVSLRALSSRATVEEIPDEMRNIILEIEEFLNEAPRI